MIILLLKARAAAKVRAEVPKHQYCGRDQHHAEEIFPVMPLAVDRQIQQDQRVRECVYPLAPQSGIKPIPVGQYEIIHARQLPEKDKTGRQCQYDQAPVGAAQCEADQEKPPDQHEAKGIGPSGDRELRGQAGGKTIVLLIAGEIEDLRISCGFRIHGTDEYHQFPAGVFDGRDKAYLIPHMTVDHCGG